MRNEFSGKAAVYNEARPGYAPAALDFIASQLPAGARVADVGAGTGKLTAMLAQLGFSVTAVEPNADMRAYLQDIPGIAVVNASAEHTGLPDSSVAAITVAQAFHWFDSAVFKAECNRVLRPGGQVYIIYNRPGPGNESDSSELIWYSGSVRRAQPERRIAAVKEFFGSGMQCLRFSNPRDYDRAGYLAFMLSHSYSPKAGDGVYQRFVQSVNAIFDRRSENGVLCLPFETMVYMK
jgi:SAM-dependent methyltransferase